MCVRVQKHKQSPKIDPNTYGQLIFIKDTKKFNEKKRKKNFKQITNSAETRYPNGKNEYCPLYDIIHKKNKL